MVILYVSKKIFSGLENESFINGGILVENGKIKKFFKLPDDVNEYLEENSVEKVYDYENKILMPGLIDSHVHINEPGREDWEGFRTATISAAYGGYTTIVDMPLNSIPPTTSVENFKIKLNSTINKLYVDVGFWAGVVPNNKNEIKKLIKNGVVGFKCFLCPSGVDEFQHVDISDVEDALNEMKNLNSVLAFHAELEINSNYDPLILDNDDNDDPAKFETFLKIRPNTLELKAVEIISELCEKYKSSKMHIVHLGNASSLNLLRNCRKINKNLTIETCHHYLVLLAENVPNGRTEFKCCPPIGDENNCEKLWLGLKMNDIDMVVSDHSPSTKEMKLLNESKPSFLKAWGGISSVQFGLSLFWTNCRKHNLDINDLHKLMCKNPAKLCGLDDRKSKIAEGYDADFCIWDSEEQFEVSEDIIQFKNKITPYLRMKLQGVVYATVLRGKVIYEKDIGINGPYGSILLRDPNMGNLKS